MDAAQDTRHTCVGSADSQHIRVRKRRNSGSRSCRHLHRPARGQHYRILRFGDKRGASHEQSAVAQELHSTIAAVVGVERGDYRQSRSWFTKDSLVGGAGKAGLRVEVGNVESAAGGDGQRGLVVELKRAAQHRTAALHACSRGDDECTSVEADSVGAKELSRANGAGGAARQREGAEGVECDSAGLNVERVQNGRSSDGDVPRYRRKCAAELAYIARTRNAGLRSHIDIFFFPARTSIRFEE